MKTKHTELPWVISEDDGYFDIHGKNKDYCVVGCEGIDNEANAEFITRSCNSHYEILEALEETLAEMESLMKSKVIIYQRGINISKRAKAAIAKAKGETP